MKTLASLELCAGAGGQALGLEQACFSHAGLVEIDPHACATLQLNRPGWDVICQDLREVRGAPYKGIDLLAAGIPCPPFSIAGKQLGADDERDLFPEVLRLAAECEPKAVLIENVRGLLGPAFDSYRAQIAHAFESLGLIVTGWKLLNASDFGVPQLRPRVAMVALRPPYASRFIWPERNGHVAPSVGEALLDEMSSRGWKGARQWAKQANTIAPTLVGGSRLHGGPDLGPTRARQAWAELGVEARTIAEEPPDRSHSGMPRLTVQMCALIQGFPRDWQFAGRKTQAYRQVGNAFPPPVARALGSAINNALTDNKRAGKPRL